MVQQFSNHGTGRETAMVAYVQPKTNNIRPGSVGIGHPEGRSKRTLQQQLHDNNTAAFQRVLGRVPRPTK